MGKRLDIKDGQVFNMLTVIKELPSIRNPSGQTNRVFLCKCNCGNIKAIRLVHLYRGKTISCGCMHGERHGDSGSRLYHIYNGMLGRCKPNYFESHLYYGKNISVCQEWKDSYTAFKNWAVNNGYKDNLQIDRENNSNGYYPDNCRWVTNIVNGNNRDNTFYVRYNGVDVALCLILRELNKYDKYPAIYTRIKRGWNHQEAIDTPIKIGNYSKN